MIIETEKIGKDIIDVFFNDKRIVNVVRVKENKFVTIICNDNNYGRWQSVNDNNELFAYLLRTIFDYDTSVAVLYRIWDFMDERI